MALYQIASFLALAAVAAAQAVAPYTDPKSGMTFSSLTTGPGGVVFGMAIPTTPGKDFVGMLALPITSDGGWGGVVFGSDMTGKMQIVAWPASATAVTTVLRISKDYTVTGNTAYTAGGAAVTQIAAGTYINSSYVVSTFLCKNCISADSFLASAASAIVTTAISNMAPVDVTNPASALNDHSGLPSIAGTFTLAAAKTPNYAALVAGGGGAPAAPAAAASAPAPSAAAPAPAPSAAAPAPAPSAGTPSMAMPAPNSSPAAAPSAVVQSPAASAPPSASSPAAAPAGSAAPAGTATTAGPWPPAGSGSGSANVAGPLAGAAQPSMACVCTCTPVTAAAPGGAIAAVSLPNLGSGVDGSLLVRREAGQVKDESGASSSTRADLISGGVLFVFSLGGLLIALQGMMIL